MGVEIERKFLVASDGWRHSVVRSESLRQAYLTAREKTTVRIRLIDDRQGFVTIKGAAKGLVRPEFEYEIPAADARELMALRTGDEIAKQRHHLDLPDGDWVVDVFAGRHAGLVLAEVELADPAARIDAHDWLGAEVTGDPRYYNARLAALPPDGEI